VAAVAAVATVVPSLPDRQTKAPESASQPLVHEPPKKKVASKPVKRVHLSWQTASRQSRETCSGRTNNLTRLPFCLVISMTNR
jgi:hypothetical protein